MTVRDQLLLSISKRVKDYREGEISPITPEHVDRWVSQFETNDQIVILRETNHVLQSYYISRNTVKMALKNFLKDRRISGENTIEGIRNINFLRIQKKGNSQKDMLELVDEILQEEFGFSVDDCGGSKKYLYIDDCIFTGNKFRYDLVPWIESDEAENDSKIITYHIVHHSRGYGYANDHIQRAANRKNINVSTWYHKEMKNYKYDGSSIETLWPKQVTGDKYVDEYYNGVRDKCIGNGWASDNLYRNHVMEEKLFSTPEGRDVVEKNFLKVGAKLVLGAQNPAPSMRPLGFEKLESLGFGSFFITYRNVSNNCPLALWYGDPESYGNGPLGLWYPLFTRKVQEFEFDFSSLGDLL